MAGMIGKLHLRIGKNDIRRKQHSKNLYLNVSSVYHTDMFALVETLLHSVGRNP